MGINVGDKYLKRWNRARWSMHENKTYGKEGKGTNFPTMKL